MSATITEIKAACRHVGAGPTSLRCPHCGGIMRRCCQSVLSFEHAADCKERKPVPEEAHT